MQKDVIHITWLYVRCTNAPKHALNKLLVSDSDLHSDRPHLSASFKRHSQLAAGLPKDSVLALHHDPKDLCSATARALLFIMLCSSMVAGNLPSQLEILVMGQINIICTS